MALKYYFTPGPSELYFTVPDHMKTALTEKVASISHRSAQFQKYFKHASEQLRTLLNVPETHHIVFTSSANEIWERILQNGVKEHSFHFVNGAFSKKFYDFGVQLGKSPQKVEVPFGEGFTEEHLAIPANMEMIAVTQNETSAGVSFPVEYLPTLRKNNPDALITVDAVSSVPYPEFDYSTIDSVYFSVQKGMGLPAGLGVWILNDRCVEKATQLKNEGLSVGTYHSIPSLLKKAEVFQTPATPNVLGIYLLGKVVEDMNRRGAAVIRQETNYKAAFMYQALENSPYFEPLVKEKSHRSKTVIVAKCLEKTPAEILEYFAQKKMILGSGYGSHKTEQIRIANFPTHSKESFLMLVDLIEAM